MEADIKKTLMIPATAKRVSELMQVSQRTAYRRICQARFCLKIEKPKILTMHQFVDYFFDNSQSKII